MSESRRHTLSQAYEDQQAILERLTSRKSTDGASVELTRNAKGEIQFTVKVTDDDPQTAYGTARVIFDELAVAYPRAEG